MDLQTSFPTVEILLFIATAGGASFDAHPLIPVPDNRYFPGYNPRTLESTGYDDPGSNFAYTEVSTPFYHYYFYSPAFKISYSVDSSMSNQNLFSPVYSSGYTPEDKIYIAQDIKLFTENLGNEYHYPQFNNVRYPNSEMSTYRPKFRNQFMQKPHSTTFKTQKTPYSSQSPFFTPSFLPTVLSSGTPNIIRTEDNGKIHNDQTLSYAPSFKDHVPQIFEQNVYSSKPVLNPSLFSASPNIIRGDVPFVNKLFRPVSGYSNKPVSSSTPTSPTLPFYSPSLAASPTVSILTSTPGKLPDDSLEETLSPVFTSQTPLESFTTPASLDFRGTYPRGPLENALESHQVLFDAPGHSAPP